MFETLLEILDMVISYIFSFIKKYIFAGLIKLIRGAINFITSNILNVFSKFGELLNEIKKPFNVIFDIPFHKYFILIMDYIISIIGVLVFTGLTAYDVQKIKNIGNQIDQGSETAQKMMVLGALTLYLDFINLFLMLLRLFGNRN